MKTYAIHYKDDLKREKRASSELIYPGFNILHTEVEEFQERNEMDHRGIFKSLPDHHFTLYHNGDVIAWLILSPLDKRTAKLTMRFLSTEIDARLIEKIHYYIEDFAARKGHKSIIVYAAPTGVGFYRSLGFEYDNATIQESGMVYYLMKKEI